MLPPLKMGEIAASLNTSGTVPVVSDVLSKIYRGLTSSLLHILSTIAGKLSGPGAAEFWSSFNASIISLSLKSMSHRSESCTSLKNSHGQVTFFSCFGVVNTDSYCTLNDSQLLR